MHEPHPKVDAFFAKSKPWLEEMLALRAIVSDSALSEDFKWFKPAYTLDGAVQVMIAGLKDHCWLAFFKGDVMADPEGILIRAGDNSRTGRVIKFTSLAQIAAMEGVLRAYIAEAIRVKKAGISIDYKSNSELVFCAELLNIFDNDPDFRAAFDALTPGRQRGWNLQFSAAKQPQTRIGRITKAMGAIFDGMGPNDR